MHANTRTRTHKQTHTHTHTCYGGRLGLQLPRGEYFTIYRCKNINSDKIYALKEILIEKNKNKMNIKREFEIMRKLNHKNIVKIHDVIIDTHLSNIYFIMDYYEYGDLSKFLNKQP